MATHQYCLLLEATATPNALCDRTPPQAILELHWSPHDTTIVTASADKTLGYWDAHAGKRKKTFKVRETRSTEPQGYTYTCTSKRDTRIDRPSLRCTALYGTPDSTQCSTKMGCLRSRAFRQESFPMMSGSSKHVKCSQPFVRAWNVFRDFEPW